MAELLGEWNTGILIFGICFLILLAALFCIRAFSKRSASGYLTEAQIVRHGMGLLDGNSMSNSLEALEDSYEKGYRYIEADLSVTSDGYVVCSHGFLESDYIRTGMEYREEKHIPTLEEFQSWKIYGKYTTMTLDDLIAWMASHKDVCFFFDIKQADYEECTKISAQIKGAVGNKKRLYDRIVFSARNTEMIQAYRETGVFKWLHLWMAPEETREKQIFTPEAFKTFCQENGVSSWSIEKTGLTEELAAQMADSGMKSYVYMIETDAELEYYGRLGADCFTSDTLSPARPEEIRENHFFINASKVDGDKYIRLSWTAYEETGCCYELYRFLGDGEAVKIGETQECVFKDTDIEAGVLYRYYVKVQGTDETTPVYNRATLPKPRGISVHVENGMTVVTWTESAWADGYTIRRSTDGGKSTVTVKILFDGHENSFAGKVIAGAAYKIQAYVVVDNIRYYSGYSKLCRAAE